MQIDTVHVRLVIGEV